MNADLQDIITQRGLRYGKFLDVARKARGLKNLMWYDVDGYDVDDSKIMPHHAEALDMIQHKIARITTGDPDYIDSWQDIAGYAQLVVDILKKQSPE